MVPGVDWVASSLLFYELKTFDGSTMDIDSRLAGIVLGGLVLIVVLVLATRDSSELPAVVY